MTAEREERRMALGRVHMRGRQQREERRGARLAHTVPTQCRKEKGQYVGCSNRKHTLTKARTARPGWGRMEGKGKGMTMQAGHNMCKGAYREEDLHGGARGVSHLPRGEVGATGVQEGVQS